MLGLLFNGELWGMTCNVCSAIARRGAWFVENGSVYQGPYMSNGIAIQAATSEALALRRKQIPAKVSVQDSAGRIFAEYCLCADFKKA
jgi:hypothetical protein